MPKFSKESRDKLATCDIKLQLICNTVIEDMDFTVLIGHRNEEAQNLAWKKGLSEKKWPNSKHNIVPSIAVDIAPYPIDWKDRERYFLLAGRMLQTAKLKGIMLRWGGDWNMDGRTSDNEFDDLGHFELVL